MINISFEDLIISYRKAKVDCFYETGHRTSLNFALYEKNLFENLQLLLDQLNSDSQDWIKDEKFTGDFVFILKKVVEKKNNEDSSKFVLPTDYYLPEDSILDANNIFYSNNNRQWNKVNNVEVDFRIIGQHSINFHILSSLWIDKVGYKLEKLISKNSYGCNLKDNPKDHTDYEEIIANKKQNCHGHFKSYLTDYRKWQDNGIKKIESALNENVKILAATADFKRFYHRIDPSFLLHKDFIKFLNINYSDEDKRLTEMLLLSIRTWNDFLIADTTIPTDFKENNHCGIPLSLSASKIIANLLLTFLDKEIETQLLPIYYGRYVDDIFLVIEDNGQINSAIDFWEFISKRVKYLKTKDNNNKSRKSPVYQIPFASKSLLEFGLGKEKLFFLEGSSGNSFISTLQESLNENSSEWKMLPDSEEDLEALAKEMAKISSDTQEPVNGLRKSDGISIQRLKFALHLRNFETLVNLLPRTIWKRGLEKFFELSKNFLIAPDKLATYDKFYPRLIRLAVRAEEPANALIMFELIDKSWQQLKAKCREVDKNLIDKSHEFHISLLVEAIISSIKFTTDKYLSKEWKKLFNKTKLDLENTLNLSKDLFQADLHAIPFKNIFFDNSLDSILSNTSYIDELDTLIYDIKDIFNLELRKDFLINISDHFVDRSGIPKSLYFYTRPLNTLDITQLYSKWPTAEGFTSLNVYLDLFNITPFSNSSPIENKNLNITSINLKGNSKDVRINKTIALTCFKTESKSWIAWVRDDNADPDNTRIYRLFKLLNQVIRCNELEIDYIIFPELSIPRNILIFVALKLKSKNISLIAGVEYQKRKAINLPASVSGLVSNQLVYILNVSTNFGIEQVFISQEKIIPALKEESDLFMVGGKMLVPNNKVKYIINHGGFIFSGLICNDLLDIDNRTFLRGKIDSLIVIEWNKDVETYDSLIQATSNDLHTFIVQVNNREYGDTRLRVPFKESYKRDQVKVKGGDLDYFVATTLQITELREFQRNYRSPDSPFKPTPTGFKMSDERRFDNRNES